jgi:hypothetical protein
MSSTQLVVCRERWLLSQSHCQLAAGQGSGVCCSGRPPDKEQAWVDPKLVKAFGHPDPDAGLRNAKHLAALLARG